VNGELNPKYTSTFVFSNDFAALKPDTRHLESDDDLFHYRSEQGCSRVICFSPDHSKTLPELSNTERTELIQCWSDQTCELGRDYAWVQIFENKGEMMGCSNPHPHRQVWAKKRLPTLAEKKLENQQNYLAKHNRPLLHDYVEKEIEKKERIVCKNQDWLVVVPFGAAWPFETLLLPRFPTNSLAFLGESKMISLAKILGEITTRYDNLFNTIFLISWDGIQLLMTTLLILNGCYMRISFRRYCGHQRLRSSWWVTK